MPSHAIFIPYNFVNRYHSLCSHWNDYRCVGNRLQCRPTLLPAVVLLVGFIPWIRPTLAHISS